jgi:hypothetical protein
MSSQMPGGMAATTVTGHSNDAGSGEGRSIPLPLQAPVPMAPNQPFDPVSPRCSYSSFAFHAPPSYSSIHALRSPPVIMSPYYSNEFLLKYTQSLDFSQSHQQPQRPYSGGRAPTSAEIDAVIAAAIANAPPAPSVPEIDRSATPLMTNLLPSAVGLDGRVNLFVGNVS